VRAADCAYSLVWAAISVPLYNALHLSEYLWAILVNYRWHDHGHELGMDSMRIADPKPGFCSVCYSAKPEGRYIDFEVAFDGAPVMDPVTHTIAVIPWTGTVAGHDDLYVCETCIKAAGELFDHKPELHSRQFNEINRLQVENDGLRMALKRQGEVNAQLTDFKVQRRRVAA
jgi:hypothetical protein